ncbi:hypothetical protein HZU40_22510 [Mycolicibacterium fluoranthenivorans]|uniref:Uncharacterized protein n=1 Tax=Mycolicibacterium fluoranthenivorans TaxID=258505 RepID=A0A7G8P9H2_9MYCO|nr:hypothetical protein [Mycolicibacterium fluoranthenivorans]QNJ90988.1 hypothetical protein HZU40_22510 [Mycolicibacterium fluoranthenivorans]
MSFLSLTTDAWNSIGTWIAAVGTVGATGMAVRSARQARTIAEQSRADALEVRREEAAAKKIDQASKICAWIGVPDATDWGPVSGDVVKLSNTSDQPVHSVIVYLVWVQGAAPRTGEKQEAHSRAHESSDINTMRAVVQVLPPGESELYFAEIESRPPQGVLGVELAFTDRAGVHWVRRAGTSELITLHNDPIKHYGISFPINYATL